MSKLESNWGLKLMLDAAATGTDQQQARGEFEGLQYIGDILRLQGLEHLFGAAQRRELDWLGLNFLRSSISETYTDYAVQQDTKAFREAADRWMARARHALQVSAGSGVDNQWQEARDRYLEAARNYVCCDDLRAAGEAYSEAARCATRLHSALECAGDLVNAASCFRETAPLEAVCCLQQVIDINTEHGRLRKVAKCERGIAEIYEQLWVKDRRDVDLEKASLHYLRASEHYQGDQFLGERNKCLSKVAAFSGLAMRYSEAIAKFEEVNKLLTGDKIKAEGLFRAMLCYLVDITVKNRLPGIERATAAFEFYSDTEPQFQSGKEYDLIRGLLDDIKRQDLDKFYKDRKQYLCLREPEYWRDHMLDLIEKHLIEVLDSVDKMVFPGVP
eukprot:TRINITY_DN10154_c0_g1_i1.p1 TRINITY_DN10154_c0_g1~~TRINITY_DN10154_c0_g1_i1.p1  ORF type:complete len:388 (+),score=133.68 TRINITY_DN10154_c0_g1_i1:67-1230(+)